MISPTDIGMDIMYIKSVQIQSWPAFHKFKVITVMDANEKPMSKRCRSRLRNFLTAAWDNE